MGALRRPLFGAIAAAVLAVAVYNNNANAQESAADYVDLDLSQFAIPKAIVGVTDTKTFTIVNITGETLYEVQTDLVLETFPKSGMVTIEGIVLEEGYAWIEPKQEATAKVLIPELEAYSSVTVIVEYEVEKKGQVQAATSTTVGYILEPLQKVEVAKTVRLESEILYTGLPELKVASGQTATMVLAVSNEYLQLNQPVMMTAMVVEDKVEMVGTATYNDTPVLCEILDGQLRCLIPADQGEAGELVVALVLDPKLNAVETIQVEVEIGLSPGKVEPVKIPVILNEKSSEEEPKP